MRAAGMLAGFGRRAFALSCWGLVSLPVLQVEPVRISSATKQAPDPEPDIDWDHAQENAVVYVKKWTSRFRGTWWYFVVRAKCKDEDSSSYVCFLHVRKPAPSRSSKNWYVSSLSWASMSGGSNPTQMFLGFMTKSTVGAVQSQAAGGGGQVGSPRPSFRRSSSQNTEAQNFLEVLELEPGKQLSSGQTRALQKVFDVLCSKDNEDELAYAVKGIFPKTARGAATMEMKKVKPTQKGGKLIGTENAVFGEINGILERYYNIDMEPQIMGHIPAAAAAPQGIATNA